MLTVAIFGVGGSILLGIWGVVALCADACGAGQPKSKPSVSLKPFKTGGCMICQHASSSIPFFSDESGKLEQRTTCSNCGRSLI